MDSPIFPPPPLPLVRDVPADVAAGCVVLGRSVPRRWPSSRIARRTTRTTHRRRPKRPMSTWTRLHVVRVLRGGQPAQPIGADRNGRWRSYVDRPRQQPNLPTLIAPFEKALLPILGKKKHHPIFRI
ncbi:hypothetical protein Scep_017065 [Stephania cephalantha]|uniref:Uncharacterized protein n=1 Tax=Stephania cephalantha TaxID=152367 RepID=A0AAP0NT86_9MAGN